MKHGKVLTRAFNIIVVISITAVLCTAVFLVYRTFEKSVSADIFRYSRELEDSVRRVAGAESRRYFLLLDLAKSTVRTGDEGEYRSSLEKKAEILEKDGEIPNLVSSIGYYGLSGSETAFELNFETDEWNEINNVFKKDGDVREFDYFYAPSETEPSGLYLIVNLSDEDSAIFFRIDRSGFLDNYIREVVESSFDYFRFEWFTAPEPEFRRMFDKTFEFESLPYSFRPFSVLFNINSRKPPFVIEIPAFFEFRRFLVNEKERDSEAGDVKPEHPSFLDFSYFVKMTHEKGVYYYEIEHNAAISFIQTVVIFVIIGLLFMLLLFQLQRTRLLRSKEKEFVASVTHELRTPLTVIRSAADNLTTGIVSGEKLPVYGGLIIEQSDRLGNMIEEILLYSNFKNKKSKSGKPVKFAFKEIVSGFKACLDALGNSEGLILHWDLNGLPEKVECYPDVITLAVNNLVSNAVNHAYSAPGGEIRITIKYLIPGRLSITVEDDGRGIDPRELRHVFEPFYRDNVSRSRQERGSGLGLFIARRKAVLSGGKLTVESPYKRIDGSKPSGCRFVLTLPCREIEESANTKKENGEGA